MLCFCRDLQEYISDEMPLLAEPGQVILACYLSPIVLALLRTVETPLP